MAAAVNGAGGLRRWSRRIACATAVAVNYTIPGVRLQCELLAHFKQPGGIEFLKKGDFDGFLRIINPLLLIFSPPQLKVSCKRAFCWLLQDNWDHSRSFSAQRRHQFSIKGSQDSLELPCPSVLISKTGSTCSLRWRPVLKNQPVFTFLKN